MRNHKPTPRRALALAGAVALVLTAPAAPQQRGSRAVPRPDPEGSRPLPRPEAIAETKLLMEGINLANFRGLERLLREKPAGAEAWTYARGQALLIAETGNLLLLRPPRAQGQLTWMDQAADLRTVATRLARATADGDFERSRTGLSALAATCNRCHQTFRVPVRLTPFSDPAGGDARAPLP
jgi:hypothetical protein